MGAKTSFSAQIIVLLAAAVLMVAYLVSLFTVISSDTLSYQFSPSIFCDHKNTSRGNGLDLELFYFSEGEYRIYEDDIFTDFEAKTIPIVQDDFVAWDSISPFPLCIRVHDNVTGATVDQQPFLNDQVSHTHAPSFVIQFVDNEFDFKSVVYFELASMNLVWRDLSTTSWRPHIHGGLSSKLNITGFLAPFLGYLTPVVPLNQSWSGSDGITYGNENMFVPATCFLIPVNNLGMFSTNTIKMAVSLRGDEATNTTFSFTGPDPSRNRFFVGIGCHILTAALCAIFLTLFIVSKTIRKLIDPNNNTFLISWIVFIGGAISLISIFPFGDALSFEDSREVFSTLPVLIGIVFNLFHNYLIVLYAVLLVMVILDGTLQLLCHILNLKFRKTDFLTYLYAALFVSILLYAFLIAVSPQYLPFFGYYQKTEIKIGKARVFTSTATGTLLLPMVMILLIAEMTLFVFILVVIFLSLLFIVRKIRSRIGVKSMVLFTPERQSNIIYSTYTIEETAYFGYFPHIDDRIDPDHLNQIEKTTDRVKSVVMGLISIAGVPIFIAFFGANSSIYYFFTGSIISPSTTETILSFQTVFAFGLLFHVMIMLTFIVIDRFNAFQQEFRTKFTGLSDILLFLFSQFWNTIRAVFKSAKDELWDDDDSDDNKNRELTGHELALELLANVTAEISD